MGCEMSILSYVELEKKERTKDGDLRCYGVWDGSIHPHSDSSRSMRVPDDTLGSPAEYPFVTTGSGVGSREVVEERVPPFSSASRDPSSFPKEQKESQHNRIVAALLLSEDGLTRNALCDRTGIKYQSMCLRLRELEKTKRIIVEAGDRRVCAVTNRLNQVYRSL